jgi:iron complex transport system substrate-binding protein
MPLSAMGLSHCKRSQPAEHYTGPPRRWVSLAPNTTELLFALGFGDRVVGISTFCDFPEATKQIVKVGSFATVSVEAILAQRPDAVVGVIGLRASLIERLTQLGVRTLLCEIESAAQIVATAKRIAALQQDVPRGENWSAQFMREIAAQTVTRPPSERPSVLAVVNQSPIVAAGPRSFVNELLTLAGARNVLTDGPLWPQLSVEAVLQMQPSVLLDLTGTVDSSAFRQSWSAHPSLIAVQKNNLFSLTDPLVTRPGPRMPQAIAMIAHALASARP